MTEKSTPKIEPLTEQEISDLAAKLEETGDFDSDLSRAIFTILVIGFEYQQLYTTLQAYYAAASAACHDTAGTCAQIIGLRDVKKIQKMYKVAAIQAGNIPARAQALLSEPEVAQEEETTTEKEETHE
jgi:hypothetical protein